MQTVVILAALALTLGALSCKKPSRAAPPDATARLEAASAAASASASSAARNDAPPDEVFWVGELTPGALERHICFSSSEPLRPIATAAADPDSYLFVARVVAQGWTEKPSAARKRVGSLYLDVIESLRGEAIRPGILVAMPIDEEPCRDGGVCTPWGSFAPNSTVVVGCRAPKPHAPHMNAITSVAGPRATAVDELRAIAKPGKKKP